MKIGERWPRVKDAPHPTNITWNNLGFSLGDRILRTGGVFLLSIVISLMGFAIVVFLIDWQGNLSSSEQCGGVNYTKSEAYADF